MNLRPYIKLPAKRTISIPWIPDDLRNFYSSHEGVGLSSSPDYSVRLCNLGELAQIHWRDLHILGGTDAEGPWADFAAIRIGISSFFDEIVYILSSPVASQGAIMAFGVDVAGPSGSGEAACQPSLVLAKDFDSWMSRLKVDDWIEYGLGPGGIRELSRTRQQFLYKHFLSLNPLIQWNTP